MVAGEGIMQSELEKWVKGACRKGSAGLAMLSLLNARDMYGYELTHELNRLTDGVFSLRESNAYPRSAHHRGGRPGLKLTGKRPKRACRRANIMESHRLAERSSKR